MQLEINIVDAFTDRLFQGNSAAVIVTDDWLSDDVMQSIATENNLSETAFLVVDEQGVYHIRWFSPMTEIAFCGHATLASASVLFNKHPEMQRITLFAKAVGSMSVVKTASGKIQMDFPNTKPAPIDDIPHALLAGLSIAPVSVYRNNQAYFVRYDTVSDVLSVQRDNEMLAQLAPRDVVVTAAVRADDENVGDNNFAGYDFVSRYFWPANGGDEDPVTGSIHTGLAPFWAERLGKLELTAYQASRRGGIVHCEVAGDRVRISGNAVHYLTGTIHL